MFSKEKHYFYYTPALPEYLGGEKQVKDFIIHGAQWHEKNRIDLFLETEITQIDPQKKVALTSKGAKYPFDQLLLACGGKSFVPPIPGASSPGVFTLRTIEDADAIRKKLPGASKAVVIGGGLLGLEPGNGLRKAAAGGLGGGVLSPAPAEADRHCRGGPAATADGGDGSPG